MSDAVNPVPIAAHHVAQVVDLIGRCYAEYGLTLVLDDPCEVHLREPGAYFREGGGDFWVLEDEARVVRATVALHLTPRPGRGPEAELKSMYVDAAWRRRGVGRRLTLHVIEAARRAGASTLELWSDTRFHAAHAMYESLGFVRIGRRDIEDSNDSSEWGYRLELARTDVSPTSSERAGC